MPSGTPNIAAAHEQYFALHYLNSPKHAHAVLQTLAGMSKALFMELPDDPALAAYRLRDVLPEMYAHLHDLNRWMHAVIEASPDQIPESGARLCH